MEQKKEPIYRSRVLDEMDVRTFPDGRKRIFSIKFVTKEGRPVYFPQAYACGAGRMNNKVFRVRGVQACDCQGNPEPGIHVYPVRIFNIIQYNGHPVQ